MTRASLDKYRAFARIALAQARRDRSEVYGRIAFFAVILGVFSSLWRAVAEAGMPLAGEPRALVWYLAATEWILLSAPTIHFEIQEAIRRGDVVYHIGRPASYVVAEFATGLGLIASRAPLLGLTAFGCAFAFTGMTPAFRTLAFVVPFGLAAMALITGMYLCLGLLAFWLQDMSPVFWVWQKLLFILGGLMLPLALYPRPMRAAAAFTPFPALLGGPASFVLPTGLFTPGVLAMQLAFWSCVTALVARWMFRRAVSVMTINGG